MVRESRIKEERFTYGPIDAASPGVTISSDSGMAVNGRIIEVLSLFNQNGSLALYEAEVPDREILRLNASSGLISSYPRYFGQLNTGSIAGAGLEPYSVNGPLEISTGSLVSGTDTALTVVVRYI